MKFATPPFVLLGLSLYALAQDPPKTNSSQKVDSGLLTAEPYRYTGIVFSEDRSGDLFRGSGVVASDPKLFFTASHLLFDDEKMVWTLPPEWVGGYSADGDPGLGTATKSRGYFRWTGYSNVVTEHGTDSQGAFARDISLAWGLEDFITGAAAPIDFKGSANLKKPKLSMITGYPALLDYTGEDGGFFLHSTEPDFTPFRPTLTNYLYATHISTGPGNSGGPVWSQDDSAQWRVSGLLVSGRPSEAGVYGMTSTVKSLLRAAAPAIGDPRKSVKAVPTISTNTCRMVMNKPKKIPDGVHRWTRIPLKCLRFEEESTVGAAYIDLTITTGHRGDLIVAVLGPDGTFAIIHDGQGAGEDDLVIDDLDISEAFEDASPVGNWQVLVQDRLTEDPCVVTRLELEIVSADKEVNSGE